MFFYQTHTFPIPNIWMIVKAKNKSLYRPIGTILILEGGCERKNLRPQPLGRWKRPLFYKLHYLFDKKMRIFSCLFDDDHYLQNLEIIEGGGLQPPGSDGPALTGCRLKMYRFFYAGFYCINNDDIKSNSLLLII